MEDLLKYQLSAICSFLESALQIYKDLGKNLCGRLIKKGLRIVRRFSQEEHSLEVSIFKNTVARYSECIRNRESLEKKKPRKTTETKMKP